MIDAENHTCENFQGKNSETSKKMNGQTDRGACTGLWQIASSPCLWQSCFLTAREKIRRGNLNSS